MKILLSSYVFSPSIGGLESVSRLLAERWVELGHDVVVVTDTFSDKVDSKQFRVVRRPSFIELSRLIRWSDLYVQNNISLRLLAPWFWFRRPLVIVPQPDFAFEKNLVAKFKRLILKRATIVSICCYVQSCFKAPSAVIPNPYDEGLFQSLKPSNERERDFIFVGRLVHHKGVEYAIRAVNTLRAQGKLVNLSVVGSGPDEERLERLVAELAACDYIKFLGPLEGAALVDQYNAHRVSIVPTLTEEPFGVVCLEAAACGCVVTGSDHGGIPEAIGPCGLLFSPGNVEALATCLLSALTTLKTGEQDLAARLHLERHTSRKIALEYANLFKDLVYPT